MDEIQHPAEKHRYITTISGVNIGPPGIFQPRDVRMTDIMDSLCKLCRYNGHVARFYSVAEHSVLVSYIAEAFGDIEARIPGLLHDAHEAYFGDYASPQKKMILGAEDFERDIEGVVQEALQLPMPDDPVWQRVKAYDTMILHRELKVLRPVLPDWFDPSIEDLVPEEVQPVGHEWQEARSLFRARLRELGVLSGN